MNSTKTGSSRTITTGTTAFAHCVFVVLAAVPLHTHAAILEVQQPDSAAKAHTAVATVDASDDGPHIYWQNDSTAYIFYLCDDQVVSRGQRVADSLRFSGLCGDSTMRYNFTPSAPEIEPHVFDDVPRIFAVSDIHGEYEALIDLLKNASVIDEHLHWSWGDGHLVVLGDVFDRGNRVTECLWLIHRLEREARASGGRVHFALGNHEQMVLRGDLRYVNRKYLSGISDRTDIPYDDLFGPHMELGRWLRTKHVALRLNDILFVHGGIPLEAVDRGLGLDTINEAVRRSLDFRSYELLFSDLEWFLLSSAGPLWYRGYHQPRPDHPQITDAELKTVLEFFEVETVVVGHHEIGQVAGWFDNRVYGIDVAVDELGGLQGLLWEFGEFFKVLGSGLREPISQR